MCTVACQLQKGIGLQRFLRLQVLQNVDQSYTDRLKNNGDGSRKGIHSWTAFHGPATVNGELFLRARKIINNEKAKHVLFCIRLARDDVSEAEECGRTMCAFLQIRDGIAKIELICRLLSLKLKAIEHQVL